MGYPKLLPLNLPCLHDSAHLTFSACQLGAAGLYLHKHDPLDLTIRQAVEDDEIDRAAEKADVLRIVWESGEVRDHLFIDLPSGNGPASLNRVLSYQPCVAELPDQSAQSGYQGANYDSNG